VRKKPATSTATSKIHAVGGLALTSARGYILGMTLSEFKKAHAALDTTAFCARYTHPFLVLVTHEAEIEEARAFRTLHLDAALKATAQAEPEVFAVQRAGSPDGTMVTVGRTRNTDIVIDSPAVSKLHAYFQLDMSGNYTLTDAGSRNGTTLNGVALEPKVPVKLKDGDTIVFAKNFRGMFWFAGSLHKMLPILRP
jgi:hypothetical protein